MFLHSGSRGVGNKIAQKHIKAAQAYCEKNWIQLPHRDLAYLVEGTAEFDSYLADLHWAQRFAFDNREEMMDRFADELPHFWARTSSNVSGLIATTTTPSVSRTTAARSG